MRLGWHLGNDHGIRDADWSIMQRVRPDMVTFLPSWELSQQDVTTKDIERILGMSPGCHVFLRPYIPSQALEVYAMFEGILEGFKQVMDTWHDIIPDGQRHLQVFNEPNMPWRGSREAGYEGFGVRDEDLVRFNERFVEAYHALKAHDPATLIGFPPLTIGNRDTWFPGDPEQSHYMHGIEGCGLAVPTDAPGPCDASLRLADEYMAHVYVHARDGLTAMQAAESSAYGQRHREYQSWFPRAMRTWIPECGAPNEFHQKQPGFGDALIHWLDLIEDSCEGVAFWILGKHEQWGNVWGGQSALVERLAAWQASHPHVDIPTESELERQISDMAQAVVLPLNSVAALAKAGIALGYVPASDEFIVSEHVAQVFRDPANTAWQHIAYCKRGDWANVKWIRRAN